MRLSSDLILLCLIFLELILKLFEEVLRKLVVPTVFIWY